MENVFRFILVLLASLFVACGHGPTTSDLLEEIPDAEELACLETSQALAVVDAETVHNCGAIYKGQVESSDGVTCNIKGTVYIVLFEEQEELVGELRVDGSVCGIPSTEKEGTDFTSLCVEQSGQIVGHLSSDYGTLGLLGQLEEIVDSLGQDSLRINGEIWKLEQASPEDTGYDAPSPWGELKPVELLGTYVGTKTYQVVETEECQEFMGT